MTKYSSKILVICVLLTPICGCVSVEQIREIPIGKMTGGRVKATPFETPSGMVRVTNKFMLKSFASHLKSGRLIGAYMGEKDADEYGRRKLGELGALVIRPPEKPTVVVSREKGYDQKYFNEFVQAITQMQISSKNSTAEAAAYGESFDDAVSEKMDTMKKALEKSQDVLGQIEILDVETSLIDSKIFNDKLVAINLYLKQKVKLNGITHEIPKVTNLYYLLDKQYLYSIEFSKNHVSANDEDVKLMANQFLKNFL